MSYLRNGKQMRSLYVIVFDHIRPGAQDGGKEMKRALIVLAAASLLIGLASSSQARKWTIYERQVAEQKRINGGEHSGELTKKEADGLRDDMSDIANRISKMKDKNGGKISYSDEGKLEKNLNKVTLKIEKLRLEKRVTPK